MKSRIMIIAVLLTISLFLNIILVASEDQVVVGSGIGLNLKINQTGEKVNQTNPHAETNPDTNTETNNTNTNTNPPTDTNTNTETQTPAPSTGGGGGGGGGGSSSSSSTTIKNNTNSSIQKQENSSIDLKVTSEESSTQENIAEQNSAGITGAVVGSSLTDKLKLPIIITIITLVIALAGLLAYKNISKKSDFATP